MRLLPLHGAAMVDELRNDGNWLEKRKSRTDMAIIAHVVK
jgi:hypothetical protein